MAHQIGTKLPPELLRRLGPGAIESHPAEAVLMVTRDPDGWPRPAMLSHFELVARSATELRMAVYGDSTAARNLRRDGMVTLVVIDKGCAYYIKGKAGELTPSLKVLPHSALMRLQVTDVLADQADPDREGSVRITSGVTFETSALKEKLAAASAMFAEMLA